MAFFRWIIGFFLTICVALFSVFNRGEVSVIWSPVHDSLLLPFYVPVLVAMAFGFVLGGAIVWLNMGRVRKEKRRQKKEIKILKKDIKCLKEKHSPGVSSASDIFPALPVK